MAKIEVELDDSLYETVKELFPPDIDMGVLISEMLKQIVIMYAINPEEFVQAFSAGGSIEDAKLRAKMSDSGGASILRRLKRTEEE